MRNTDTGEHMLTVAEQADVDKAQVVEDFLRDLPSAMTNYMAVMAHQYGVDVSSEDVQCFLDHLHDAVGDSFVSDRKRLRDILRNPPCNPQTYRDKGEDL